MVFNEQFAVPIIHLNSLVDNAIAEIRAADFVLLNAVWHLNAELKDGRLPLLQSSSGVPCQIENERLVAPDFAPVVCLDRVVGIQ